MVRIEELGRKNLKIKQDDNYFCFGIDSVLLSDFVEAKKTDWVLDIGCGNGIIPILLYGRDKGYNIDAIEIQENLAKLAVENVKFNSISNVNIINMDIRKFNKDKKYDVIVSNPPYEKINSGIISLNKEKAIARVEIMCSIDELFRSTARLIKENGKFFIVHKADRIVDVFEVARKYKLEPKVIRFIKSKSNTSPKLCLIKFIKGAKQFLRIMDDLVIYNDDGSYTDEVIKIYS